MEPHIKIHGLVGDEREYQLGRWGREHDALHTSEEWRQLIDLYVSQGRYIEAAAICEAAAEFSYSICEAVAEFSYLPSSRVVPEPEVPPLPPLPTGQSKTQAIRS